MMQANAVIEAANLQDIYPLERLEGREGALYPAQEVWGYGPYVLRIEPNSPALAAEARVLRILPGSIPHAAVIASGDGWLVQRRVAGEPLNVAWKALSEAKRRAAMAVRRRTDQPAPDAGRQDCRRCRRAGSRRFCRWTSTGRRRRHVTMTLICSTRSACSCAAP
ncbi:MAG: hypothetical protein U0521_06555 [Anaerolineae bacterium]